MQLDERNKYYQVLKKHEHNKDQVSKRKQAPSNLLWQRMEIGG